MSTPRPVRRRGRARRTEGGYVTAEAAVVLPVLLVVLAMGLWVLAAVSSQLRCTDAAGLAARAAARGDDPAQVRQAAQAAAPRGARVEVQLDGDLVRVTVHARVRPLAHGLSGVPAVAVTGRAVAAREDAPPAPAGSPGAPP